MGEMMKSIHLVDNWISKLNFTCALSEEEKRQAYQLRYDQAKTTRPNVTCMEQVIDQFDKTSTHILIKDVSTGLNIATVRLSDVATQHSRLPCQSENTHSLAFINQFLKSGSQLSVSEISGLNISQDIGNSEFPINHIVEAAYLAAFCLARLRFDDRILVSLPYQEFKRLRARGMFLEHTSTELNTNSTELFWLSSEFGINEASPLYELYQHILGSIAKQVIQVQVDSNSYLIQENQ